MTITQEKSEILEQQILEEEIAQLIDSLCVKSMIAYAPIQDSSGRYNIQETVRLYLSELQTSSEKQNLRVRHAIYFTDLASQWAHHTTQGTIYLFSEKMHVENENIVALMTLSYSNDALREQSLKFSWFAGYYWISRGKVHEGKELLKQLLLTSDKLSLRNIDTIDEARATTVYAQLENGCGNYAIAEKHLKRSIRFLNKTSDLQSKAISLGCYGSVLARTGRHELAIKALEETICLFEQDGDQVNVARYLNNISTIYVYTQQYTLALLVLKRASEILNKLQLYRDLAINKNYLADVYIYLKDYENSRINLLESASVLRRQNEAHLIISLLATCYSLMFETGDFLFATKMIAAVKSFSQATGLELSKSGVERVQFYLDQICKKVSMYDFNAYYREGDSLTHAEFMDECVAWLRSKNFSEKSLESTYVMGTAENS